MLAAKLDTPKRALQLSTLTIAFGLLLHACDGRQETSSPQPPTHSTATATPETAAAPDPEATQPSVFAQPLATVSANQLQPGDDTPLQYRVITTGGASSNEKLPWIVALHGLGDTAQSFARLFIGRSFRSHVYVARAPYAYGRGYDWFNARLNGDPERLDEGITDAARRVLALIRRLKQDETNQGKPLVTGFSQGGILSFSLATLAPEQLLAALPLGGTLPRRLWPSLLPTGSAPIRAFHGAADRVVPVAPTEKTVAHLSSLGFDVALKTYPDLRHSLNPALVQDWDRTISTLLAN